MKKLFNYLLVAIILIGSTTQVEASSEVLVEVTKNSNNGSEFTFEIEYQVAKARKGDSFIVEFPFPINVKSNDIVEITGSNGKYLITFLDDYENVKGNLGGKRVTLKENLQPLVVNGKAIEVDYNAPTENDGNIGTGTRDRVYKHGTIDGDIINWNKIIKGVI